MKTKEQRNQHWGLVVLALILLAFIIATFVGCNGKKIEDLERAINEKSLELNRLHADNMDLLLIIDSLESDYDTIELKRTIYRTRFDTVFVKELINKKEIDSAARANLQTCLELDRINEKAISKLKAINTEKDVLIRVLQDEIAKCYDLNNDKQELLLEYRTANKELTDKLNRRTTQRNLTFIGIITIGVLYIILGG